MFGSLFRSNPPAAAAGPALPLGFRLGGAVSIDDTLYKAYPKAFGFEPPRESQIIDALGTVSLPGGVHLYRMYLTDDAWIQVKTSSGEVDDIKLFVFAKTINPANADAFQRWVEPGSELGAESINFEGRVFARVWGDSGPGQWSPPVAYDESVVHPAGGEEDFEMSHYSMLYQRAVAEIPGRMEYLFVTAEDYGPDKFDVVYSLGSDITTADLSIV